MKTISINKVFTVGQIITDRGLKLVQSIIFRNSDFTYTKPEKIIRNKVGNYIGSIRLKLTNREYQ